MSVTRIELVVEGPAVREGTMDADAFAASLSGFSEVFKRANELVNGEASSASVLVESEFKTGSFIAGLQLEQHTIESAQQLITNHSFLSAAALASMIGFIGKNKDSLIELWKFLKGKKPEAVNQIGNSTEITIGQNRKTVSNIVYNFYGDSAMRAAMGRTTRPLRMTEIDRLSIKQNGEEQTRIEKSEAEFFESAGPLELSENNLQTSGERETVLVVSKLSFNEGTTWSFIEQGATLVAKIVDPEFWAKVHAHTITFGEGDSLRVRLKWEIVVKNYKLRPKNTIVKVLRTFERPKQKRLQGVGL